VSGSYDATIKVWCLRTGNCLRTLTGHEDRVLCLFWDDEHEKMLSGSTDRTIKVGRSGSSSCLGADSPNAPLRRSLSHVRGRLHVRFTIRYESAPILNWTRFNFPGNYHYPCYRLQAKMHQIGHDLIFSFLFRESYFFCLVV
jgi:WD40 repeat protein